MNSFSVKLTKDNNFDLKVAIYDFIFISIALIYTQGIYSFLHNNKIYLSLQYFDNNYSKNL